MQEDITSEDVSTNSVMPEPKKGEVQLICKQDGIICGLPIFARVFTLLDENTGGDLKVKDGDKKYCLFPEELLMIKKYLQFYLK